MDRDPRIDPKPGDWLTQKGVNSPIVVVDVWRGIQVTWMHSVSLNYPSTKRNLNESDWEAFLDWSSNADVVRKARNGGA